MSTNEREIAAFVASVTLGTEREPISCEDAEITLNEWMREGMELPKGITAKIFADEFNRMIADERSMNMSNTENLSERAESILETTRTECLIGMSNASRDARVAWFYTHCGEIEMAKFLGLIDEDRRAELTRMWRKECDDTRFLRIRDRQPPQAGSHEAQMAAVARSAMSLLKATRPDRDIEIAYSREDEDSVQEFSQWQRESKGIRAGDEYFLVWDVAEGSLLYAVNVSADSPMCAAWELYGLLSKKF